MLSVVAGAAIAYVRGDEKEIGRTNPRLAASYSPPWGNFVETYTDGTALGFTVGMPRESALEAAAKSGFTVAPNSWGDNRAGGSSLYTAKELRRQAMLAETLDFESKNENVEVLYMSFNRNRIRSITVGYINNGL